MLKRMMLLAVFVLAALLAGCGGGGGGGGGTNTTVTGTVRDSARADAPVPAGVSVTIGSASTTTGTDGTFTLRGAPAGATTATIVVNGTTYTVAFSPSVAPSGITAVGDLFINIGQVSGRLVIKDAAGVNQPAANGFVTISWEGGSDDVQTGADGRFRIDNIPAGAAELNAVLSTASASQAITVQNGLTDIGDVLLVNDPNPNPPAPPYTIVGTVLLPDGASAVGVTVQMLRGDTLLETTTTDASGAFGFVAVPGVYGLRFVQSGFAVQAKTATVTDPSVATNIGAVTLTP